MQVSILSFQIALVKVNLHVPHIPVTLGASQTELHLFLTFPWEGKVRAIYICPPLLLQKAHPVACTADGERVGLTLDPSASCHSQLSIRRTRNLL